LVNLSDSEEIYDLYDTVTDAVRMLLETAKDEEAIWWLEHGITRDILKQPIMTFSYGVTEVGATEQIIDACENHNMRPNWRQALYLAKKVLRAAKTLLKRPAEAMDFMRNLAKYRNEANLPLKWVSPTGLPVSNLYCEPNVRRVEMPLRGTTVAYRVADGYGPKILKRKAADAAPANLVHSMDAAHLIRSANAGVAAGITNVVSVHDCYGTTAPQVTRFQQIIRREMTLMYLCHDPLARLWRQNGAPNDLAIPEAGNLDLFEVQKSEYSFK
jgi:DNA-directed RNA polymerase